MNRFSMKVKMLLSAIVPSVLITIATLVIVINSQFSALENEVKDYQSVLTVERQNNIKDAATVAQAVIEDVVARLGTGEEAKQAARAALKQARFAEGSGIFLRLR